MPQFEAFDIAKEVSRLRPFSLDGPAGELNRRRARQRAHSYLNDAYGPREAVSVFLGLGIWTLEIREALEAVTKLRIEESKKTGKSWDAQKFMHTRARKIRENLHAMEIRMFEELKWYHPDQFAEYEAMCQVTRERMWRNRNMSRRWIDWGLPAAEAFDAAPENTNPALHCDFCFNKWPWVKWLAPAGAWDWLDSHKVLFLCSTGCGRYLCSQCRTVLGACMNHGACRDRMRDPRWRAVHFLPAESESVQKWHKTARSADYFTNLAGEGKRSDGTVISRRLSNLADEAIAHWLAQQKQKEKAVTHNSQETSTAGCEASGQSSGQASSSGGVAVHLPIPTLPRPPQLQPEPQPPQMPPSPPPPRAEPDSQPSLQQPCPQPSPVPVAKKPPPRPPDYWAPPRPGLPPLQKAPPPQSQVLQPVAPPPQPPHQLQPQLRPQQQLPIVPPLQSQQPSPQPSQSQQEHPPQQQFCLQPKLLLQPMQSQTPSWLPQQCPPPEPQHVVEHAASPPARARAPPLPAAVPSSKQTDPEEFCGPPPPPPPKAATTQRPTPGGPSPAAGPPDITGTQEFSRPLAPSYSNDRGDVSNKITSDDPVSFVQLSRQDKQVVPMEQVHHGVCQQELKHSNPVSWSQHVTDPILQGKPAEQPAADAAPATDVATVRVPALVLPGIAAESGDAAATDSIAASCAAATATAAVMAVAS